MKVLSVRQPWAHLLAKGIKDVETSTEHTSHRGPLLIHASQARDASVYQDTATLVDQGHLDPDEKVLFGGIVGEVELFDVVEKSESEWATDGAVHLCVRNAKVVPFVKTGGVVGLTDVEWPQDPSPADVKEGCALAVGELAAKAPFFEDEEAEE